MDTICYGDPELLVRPYIVFLNIETTALQHSIFDLKELVSIFVLQSDTWK